MGHFKRYFFLYTLVLLVTLATAASYYRFIELQDYTVTYEVDCNPEERNCFIGCENDECTEQYYYKLVTRMSTDIEAICGQDITDCEAAAYCTEGERQCSLEYCDSDDEFSDCTADSQISQSL